MWQVLPYVLLTCGEVLVSATDLEFAYSQAPHSMKGVMMSFWYLVIAFGNLWVLIVNAGVRSLSAISYNAYDLPSSRPLTRSNFDVNQTDGSTPRKLRGVIAAIPTPVGPAGPDHARLITLARQLLDSGCDGLNVLGTTGEATSFSVEQRMAVMTAFAQSGLPMSRLMVGTGAAALADAIALSRHAAALGFSGVLLLPPFYYKGVSDAGIVAYVERVAEGTASSAIPIYLYNFPALSGIAYTLPLVRELVRQFGTRIAGLKDSSGDVAYAREVAAISSSLAVFPSNEAQLLHARSGPFAGCISASVNVNPRDSGRVFAAGDEAALARAIATRKIFDGLPLIPAVKYLLSLIHADPALMPVMPPLVALTPAEAQTVRARFDAIKAMP